jgi:thiopeptide-type bacteriocin biosynthesis protein
VASVGSDQVTGAVGAQERVDLPGGALPLPEFLAECSRTLGDPTAPIAVQRDLFLAAGLAALRQAPDGRRWTAVGLQPAPGRSAALWVELAATARELLAGGASNFFFMQKPPGLRVRFEAAEAAGVPGLADVLRERAAGWRRAGLVADVVPGGYEPEQHLFGGPLSMRYVHRLFTVDSLAWLDFHAGAGGALPGWAFSLYALRTLLDGLEVVGWEDLDVWDRVRRQAFRTLPAPVTAGAAFAPAAAGVRAAWAASRGLPGPDAAGLVGRVRAEVAEVAAGWLAGYFAGPQTSIGPREACAFATIFHWNRGGLSALRQGLIAEALTDRPAG